jgi:hypothetical protein
MVFLESKLKLASNFFLTLNGEKKKSGESFNVFV